MKHKCYAAILLGVWGCLTLLAWFGPQKDVSDSERRPLAQMPALSAQAILSGNFAEDFESFTLDQFPLRDPFRQAKALFHYYVLGQKDNNGIYLHNGYAAQQVYPLSESSLNHAIGRFQAVYDAYLTDSSVFMAVIPDKNYYLAAPAGQPSLDYEALYAQVRHQMPWATHIDLTEVLSLDSYYRTDTHWRQEALPEAAEVITRELGVSSPGKADDTETTLERPFYGVYYGQAALPMKPDTIRLLESETTRNATVYDHETGKTGAVYDESKLSSKDLYDVYLSGARALLTIENPAGDPGRELLLFRDSFGSSLAPLLLSDYSKVTLIDLRYIRWDLLDQFVDFHGQDALFLYSTLVLNESSAIK